MGLSEKRGTAMPSDRSRRVFPAPRIPPKTVAEEVAGALAAPLGASVEIVDLTLPGHRPADALVRRRRRAGVRLPGVRRARARAAARRVRTPDRPRYARRDRGLYGNRDFDDALLEAADLLGERGFDVVAAGAFIGPR